MIETVFREFRLKFTPELQAEIQVGFAGAPPLLGEGIGGFSSRTY